MGRQNLGTFSTPEMRGGSTMGIQEIMPFVSQMAMLRGMGQKSNIGAGMVNAPPGGMIPKGFNSPFGAQFENPQAPAEVERLKEAQDTTLKGEAALNNLRYGVSRFKSLETANQQSPDQPGYEQRVRGFMGHLKGMAGMNPEETAWNQYADSVAVQLSAAASPRTPTLLVEKYRGILGNSSQTFDEFSRHVHTLVSEVKARMAGYSGTPYDQNEVDSLTGDILSTHPASQFNWHTSSWKTSPNPNYSSPSPVPGMGQSTDPLDKFRQRFMQK